MILEEKAVQIMATARAAFHATAAKFHLPDAIVLQQLEVAQQEVVVDHQAAEVEAVEECA